jgi:hypothetical protein
MKTQNIFKRDIERDIRGVVKANQIEPQVVWEELDEFVLTKELVGHFYDLVEVLKSQKSSSISDGGKNGVWISGFFGSGKSHFIKVLSYLLENKEYTHETETKRAIDFFKNKIEDPILFKNLTEVVSTPTDAILFNIDNKADTSNNDRNALLHVFLKVFNESQGYCASYPHVAHLERYLEGEGKLQDFHDNFKIESGELWLDKRDNYSFLRDQVIAALVATLDQSEESVKVWVDNPDDNFSLSVELFAQWVSDYLDTKKQNHRIIFIADEVGQFIGNDTYLMLNLQTITEELGRVCNGRAWVVATSQEDLDAVLGGFQTRKQNDFSKIQGRFVTRLSLSSSNVDEVIKRRLLEKNDSSIQPLEEAYKDKHDILKNQLSFVDTGMHFKHYEDTKDFIDCYPFPAYQFNLVQKVFESIRKAGVTGMSISRGERSTLDAFQKAAQEVGEKEIGALVSFCKFYPSVEGFLDTQVKKTIQQAEENHALESFDNIVLKVLFLIRYIEEIPGNVENLVTLCVEEIDTDKLSLRKNIEESLARLEGETLVARNGAVYSFLTNEERDIGREIKAQNIPSGSEERELGKIIFEDILGDIRKHEYRLTKKDFYFTRSCDDFVIGNRVDGSIEVLVSTPLGENYSSLCEDEIACATTITDFGKVLVRLPEDATLGSELRVFIQTESYIKTKNTATLVDTTRRILRDRSEENRTRRNRIVATLEELLSGSSCFSCGKKLDAAKSNAKDTLSELLEYAIKNSYSKMNYINYFHPNIKHEIQSTLRANDVAQTTIKLETDEANSKALEELRKYIQLCKQNSKQIVLHELINKKYGLCPYGWPELEISLLVSRLAVLKEISLIVDQKPLSLDQAYDYLITSSKQRKVIILLREIASGDVIKSSRDIAYKIFAKQGPNTEDELFDFISDELKKWNNELRGFKQIVQSGIFPGEDEIDQCLETLRKFAKEEDSLRFLNWFIEDEEKLLAVEKSYKELHGFFTNQQTSWKKLQESFGLYSQNSLQLEENMEVKAALVRMGEIANSSSPYVMLHEVNDLVHTVSEENNCLIAKAKEPVETEIRSLIEKLNTTLNDKSIDEALRSSIIEPLQSIFDSICDEKGIANINQARAIARDRFEQALERVNDEEKISGGGGTRPVITKTHRTVEAKNYCSIEYMETEDEVDAFIKSLREVLIAAVKSDEKIRIK